MADSDNDSGGGGGGSGGQNREFSLREQDRFLPIANVSRIMKKALPANAKISKEAKETVQECVSEFISFVTGEASDKCQREKRKTINGDDLLWGMMTLGFEDYVEPLKVYLQRFREMEGEKTAMAGRQGGENDASNSSGSVVNFGSSGTGLAEGGLYREMPMMMGGHQPHDRGPVFGSGVYQQLASGGSGKFGPGYPGSESSAGRG